MPRLPARHVHLDFHTSEHIEGIGARFKRAQFQKALKLGRVDHITIFAKCHHSWSYYPTKVGRAHPHLACDLLGEQLKACHAIGVRAPIYYTVGWSSNDAEGHPEWLARGRDGKINGGDWDPVKQAAEKKPAFQWKMLCVNTPYRQLILDQTREICATYPVDGFFYDICHNDRCFCATCTADMKRAGVDPADDAQVVRFYNGVWQRFFAECRAVIAERHPEATVFFNGRAGADTPPELLALQTHYELEDLPTTWGGYDKFAPRAKFFLRSGKPILAMSGKFHTAWGEFGGFKHPDAIRFEAASMIAFGAVCSFGDQLHPSGEMDLGTYASIGEAYRYVERIEDYGPDGVPHASLGLYTTCDDQGVANMLMERQIDYEIVDAATDLRRFETVILSGGQCLDADAAAKLTAYVAKGGSLLVLGESALDVAKKAFVIDVGATYLGPARYENDYVVVGEKVAEGMVRSPILNYEAALRARPAKGGKVLATIKEPLFDRTFGHYCSHQNTSNRLEDAEHVGGIEKGRVIFLPHRLGRMYLHHGARVHRDLFINALRRLHRRPMVEAALPSAGRINLMHQPDQRRYVLHLLYASPMQRGRCSVIEDLPPIDDVAVTVRLPVKVKRVTLPLGKKKLKAKGGAKGALSFTVPRVQCHEMVVFDY